MIVGLLGFIGSGKGTAGDILKNLGFQPVSFAKGVKDVAAEMFGWPRHLLEGDTQQSRDFRETPDAFWTVELGKEFTPRLALQLMGTEVGRDIFHQDFWVIKLKRYMEQNPDTNYVITDVRFQNEINFVHQSNGILIEIERGVRPHWYEIAAKANHGDFKAYEYMKKTGVHESEWRWIGGAIDHTIVNSGTLVDLQNKLINCLQSSYGSSMISELNKELYNETIK